VVRRATLATNGHWPAGPMPLLVRVRRWLYAALLTGRDFDRNIAIVLGGLVLLTWLVAAVFRHWPLNARRYSDSLLTCLLLPVLALWIFSGPAGRIHRTAYTSEKRCTADDTLFVHTKRGEMAESILKRDLNANESGAHCVDALESIRLRGNSHVNTTYYELVADAMQGEPPPISVNLSWATSNWDEVLRDNSYSVCSPTEVCTCRLLGYEVDVLYGIL